MKYSELKAEHHENTIQEFTINALEDTIYYEEQAIAVIEG